MARPGRKGTLPLLYCGTQECIKGKNKCLKSTEKLFKGKKKIEMTTGLCGTSYHKAMM